MENVKTDYSKRKIAAYVRVSTDEQRLHGLSIEAQIDALQEWAKENRVKIEGFYNDSGFSARKPYSKRPAMVQLLNDVQNQKIDLIIFTKLDRWFRSLPDYFKVQEILEKNRVDWKTIHEDYDTSTASGRLLVNMKLTIAQNEADLCSERISVVFDNKIKNGTVVSGRCPFGYRVNLEKRLEIVPEQATIVQDAFQHYKSTVSQRGTIKYIRETYGVNWYDVTFRRMLHDRIYTGYYEKNGRINKEFCKPIISTELFEDVQKLMSNNAKSSPTGRIYLFTSILVCEECGYKLTASITQDIVYYRCNQHFKRGCCSHNKSIREDLIEEWLLENLERVFRNWKVEWEVREAKRKKESSSIDRAAIRRKLSKLKELYLNEMIDLEEYKQDYETLTKILEESAATPPKARPNFEAVEAFLSQDFRSMYNSMEREEKRTLWRSIIKQIRIDNNQQVTSVVFL